MGEYWVAEGGYAYEASTDTPTTELIGLAPSHTPVPDTDAFNPDNPPGGWTWCLPQVLVGLREDREYEARRLDATEQMFAGVRYALEAGFVAIPTGFLRTTQLMGFLRNPELVQKNAPYAVFYWRAPNPSRSWQPVGAGLPYGSGPSSAYLPKAKLRFSEPVSDAVRPRWTWADVIAAEIRYPNHTCFNLRAEAMPATEDVRDDHGVLRVPEGACLVITSRRAENGIVDLRHSNDYL